MATLAIALATGIWQLRESRSAATAPSALQHLPVPLPPAPPDPVASITVDGHAVSCPSGTEPELVLSGATFDPEPVDGSRFDVGSYTVSLRGTVNNDTDTAIDIDALTPTVNQAAWDAAVSGPSRVSPGDAEPVSVTGTLTVTSPMDHPSFEVGMDWQWSDSTLRPCGKAGLLSEH